MEDTDLKRYERELSIYRYQNQPDILFTSAIKIQVIYN